MLSLTTTLKEGTTYPLVRVAVPPIQIRRSRLASLVAARLITALNVAP